MSGRLALPSGHLVTERTGDAALAGRLRDAAAFVRDHGTFLSDAG